MTTGKRARIVGSCPHFLVRSLPEALAYYVEKLGFQQPELWGDPPAFAMPSRDGFIVMLNQIDGREPQPCGGDLWDAYFWCDDADVLHAEMVASGALIEQPLTTQEQYGNREFTVRDLDGHLLAFGSDAGT